MSVCDAGDAQPGGRSQCPRRRARSSCSTRSSWKRRRAGRRGRKELLVGRRPPSKRAGRPRGSRRMSLTEAAPPRRHCCSDESSKSVQRSPTDPIPDLTTSGPVPGAPGSGLGIPGRTPFWEPLWARIRPKPQVGSQWDADPGRVRTGLTGKCSGPWAQKFPYQTGPRPGRDRPPTVSTWDFFVP